MLARKFSNKRLHRKYRLRFKIRGTSERPRLSVFRSARHMYAQIIDDDSGRTLAAASTLEKDLQDFTGKKRAAAAKVGELVAHRALDAGVRKLVFDRGGFLYHGRVAAVSKASHDLGLLTRDGFSGTWPIPSEPTEQGQEPTEDAAGKGDKNDENNGAAPAADADSKSKE